MSGPFRALCEGEANAASETQVGCVQHPAASGLVDASGPHIKNLQISNTDDFDIFIFNYLMYYYSAYIVVLSYKL